MPIYCGLNPLRFIQEGTDQMHLNTIIPLLMTASRIETLSQITKRTSIRLCWRSANTERQDMGPWVDKSQSQAHAQ